MTALLHCSPLNLHEFCNTHLKQGYDGTFKDFYKLIELYKHMAYQSYEIAPKVGVEPSNTSYGILCYWLDDIMKEERQKFFDTKEAECPICRSHDVKLGLFKDNFECNNCKQEFGGLLDKQDETSNIQEAEEQIFTLSCFLDAKLFILAKYPKMEQSDYVHSLPLLYKY